MTQISVVIPICGDLRFWRPLSQKAATSVAHQTLSVPYMICEANTVAEARNEGAEKMDSEYLIFLDADDELDLKYVEKMSAAIVPDLALYQPSTLGVVDGVEDPFPALIPPKASLLEGNWMVCGTMVKREQFLRVGGFDSSLEAVEDWDLWLRCWRDGATFIQVPEAIYRVNIRQGSRNDLDRTSAVRLFNKVRDRYVNPSTQSVT